MKYLESQLDNDLRNWFNSDNSKALLRSISLKKGTLRGVNSLDISFSFPVTAFVGKNGSGKSTVLAMACCGFHNAESGFLPAKRHTTYYTFRDFFIQHPEEQAPGGLTILYGIAYNHWKKTETMPDGIGLGFQSRRKKKGGKWNDYSKRVKRNVVFIGIERIVPHSERSQSKSYSKVFKTTPPMGWEAKVRAAVGRILGRQYDDFKYLQHSKYQLPIVEVKGTKYSGFNMGAGESALFEILTIIYSCGKGALIVIDEIELGLHAEAQREFIKVLKEVCLEMKTQVICTTHSKDVLDCLPLDGRFYIEKVNDKTKITEGISSDFAFSKLSALRVKELQILVEDDVAKTILKSAIPHELLNRIAVDPIGSASAVARQMAATFLHGKQVPTIAIYDGDQRAKKSDNHNHARRMLENKARESDFDKWLESKTAFLPGDKWPERWLLDTYETSPGAFEMQMGIDHDTMIEIIEKALRAGKHNEFYVISAQLGLDRNICLHQFSRAATIVQKDAFKEITEIIRTELDA